MTVFVTILVALVLQIILISKAPISLRVRLITTASILFALVLNADLQRDKRQSVILHNAAKRFFFLLRGCAFGGNDSGPSLPIWKCQLLPSSGSSNKRRLGTTTPLFLFIYIRKKIKKGKILRKWWHCSGRLRKYKNQMANKFVKINKRTKRDDKGKIGSF